MQNLLKINLSGGLKRLVSTLICLIMVLATFPMHMLKNTVCADEGATTLELKSNNIATVVSTLNGSIDQADINITLGDDITLSDTTNKMSDGYFFDFTDPKFTGKTITIAGRPEQEEQEMQEIQEEQEEQEVPSPHSITINSKDLSFLKLQNCVVVLKNIVIDGGSESRTSDFITVYGATGENQSYLSIIDVNIQQCDTNLGGKYVINNAGSLQITSGSIEFKRTTAIYNSGILILPEQAADDSSPFKITAKGTEHQVSCQNPEAITNYNAKNIIIDCCNENNISTPISTKYIGIYPQDALIDPPEIEGYTFQNLQYWNGGEYVNMVSNSDSGSFILNDEVFKGISGEKPLRAIFTEIKYKLQYKAADASEGATAIGDESEYTLAQLQQASNNKTTFESIMSAKENELKSNPGREFKGWKLGGSDFELPVESTEADQEKEEVDWDNLLENADENNTITFEAVWGPQKYIIEYRDETGKNLIEVKTASEEETDSVPWVDSNSHNSINVQEGDDIPPMEPKNLKSGSTFSGWVYGANIAFSGEADWTSLAEAAEDVKNGSGQSTGAKKIIFKAQYGIVKYFIKYINAEEDYISVNFLNNENNFYSQEVLYGNNSPQVYPPSVKYYTFDHWEYGKNASDSNKPYTTTNFQIDGGDVDWAKLSTKIGAGNVILVKAIYNPIKYIIKYKDGENNAAVDGTTLREYTINENALDSAISNDFKNGMKTGYRFNGWMYVNVLKRRCKLIPERTKWRNLVDGATESNEVVLWADYGPREYTINYDTGDGSDVSSGTYTPSDSGDNQTSNSAAISDITPTKTGYYFEKWTYGQNETAFTIGTTKWEDLVQNAELSDDGTKGTITLKANFQPREYTINYDTGDGSDVSSGTYTPSESGDNQISSLATISTDRPTKTGYYFEKWTYGNDDTLFTNSTTWEDLIQNAVLSDDGKTGTITLKANFEPMQYDIEYIDDEKSSADKAKNPKSYTSDLTFSLDSTPELDDGSKLGYAFSNWTYGQSETAFTNSTTWKNLVQNATFGDDETKGTITLKANFEPITYTIKYVTQGKDNFKDETYTTNEEGKPLDAVVKTVNLNKKPRDCNGKGFRAWVYGENGDCQFNSEKTTWEDLVRTAVGGVIYFTACYYD